MRGIRTLVVVSLLAGLILFGAFRLLHSPEIALTSGASADSAGAPAGPVADDPPPDPPLPSGSGAAGAGAGTIAGRVVLFKGREPAADVLVRLEGGPEGFEPRSEITDVSGVFLFPRVPAGTGYGVVVRHGEYATVRRLDLVVGRDEQTDAGTLFLEKAVELPVRVVDGAGAPIPAATVEVYGATPPAEGYNPSSWLESVMKMAEVPTPLRTVATDEKGEASVADLPPGYFSFSATAKGYGRAGAERLLTPETKLEPVEIRLGRGYSLTGRVTDGDGKPVEGTVILTPSVSGFRWGISFLRHTTPVDEEGKYALSGLTPGSFQVLVTRPESPPWPAGRISVPPMEEYDIDVGGSAVLEGTVANEKGQPVAGAEVRAAVYNVRGGQYFGATAESGEDGVYRLAGLPAGTLGSLQVICDGYARYPPPGTPGDALPLTAGSTTRFDVKLSRGISVTGTLTKAPDGAPVGGARVAAIPRGAWGQASWTEATTDEAGSYRLASLAPGEYGIYVQAEGLTQPEFPNPWSVQQGRGTLDDRWLLRVDVGAAEITKDLRVEVGATVAGRVEDSEGQPVAGAYVRLTRGGSVGNEISGADGSFRFVGVEPSERVQVQAWVTGRYGRSDPFHVAAAGTVEDVVVRLGAAGRVAGVVEISDGSSPDGGTAGVVRGDPRQQPWILNQNRETVPLGPDGSFVVENVPPGTVTVIAEVPGYPPAVSEPMTLPEGTERTGVRLRIEPGLTIDGIVVGEEDEPVAGAEISVRDQSGRGSFGPGGGQATVAQTGADGKFAVRGLAKGRYYVSAAKEGLTPATETNVEPATSTNLRLVLAPGKDVAGRVVDGQSAPIAGIRVSLAPMSGQRAPRSLQATTGPDGTFRIPGVPVGKWKVTAGPSGTSDLNYTTETKEGIDAGDESVLIRLDEGYPIAGRVADDQGRPAVGLRVTVFPTEQRPGATAKNTQTGADGTFALPGLPPGDYRLSLQGRGEYAPLQLSSVPAGTRNLTLVLTRAAAIEGRVFGPDGAPVVNVQIRVEPMPGLGGSAGWGRTDAEGAFSVQNLAMSTYRITFTAPGRFATVVLDDVLAGSTGVDVRMDEGETIQGVVLSPDGQPAVGVNLLARPVAGSSYASVTSGEEGKFELKALSEGKYRISASGHPQGFILYPEPEIEAGKKEVTLKLTYGLTIAGRVIDANGQGVKGSWVGFPEIPGPWVQTDDGGGFRKTGLPPGEYKVQVWRPTGGYFTRSVRAGDTAVEIRLD